MDPNNFDPMNAGNASLEATPNISSPDQGRPKSEERKDSYPPRA